LPSSGPFRSSGRYQRTFHGARAKRKTPIRIALDGADASNATTGWGESRNHAACKANRNRFRKAGGIEGIFMHVRDEIRISDLGT
jgi:hypothetical protein